MILGFKTQRNGKPTYFVEKILAINVKKNPKFVPKIHSIRKGNRWQKGMKIHMATGVRTKHYCQFNKGMPSLSEVRLEQQIKIVNIDDIPLNDSDNKVVTVGIYSPELQTTFYHSFIVRVDDHFLTAETISLLAKNDGFESVDDFFEWFDYGDFEGQIVHWTNRIKY